MEKDGRSKKPNNRYLDLLEGEKLSEQLAEQAQEDNLSVTEAVLSNIHSRAKQPKPQGSTSPITSQEKPLPAK